MITLSLIVIYSVFRTVKNYYLQLFLKECKYIAKDKKMPEYISDDIFSNSDWQDFNEELFNEENCDEEYFSEEN